MTTCNLVKQLRKVPGAAIFWIIMCAFILLVSLALFMSGEWILIIAALFFVCVICIVLKRSINYIRTMKTNGNNTISSLEHRNLLDRAAHEYNHVWLSYPRTSKAFSQEYNFRLRANAISESFVYIMRDNVILTYDEIVRFNASNWYTPGDASHSSEDNDTYYVTTKSGECYDLIVVGNRRYTPKIKELIGQTVNILQQKNPDCVIDLTLRQNRY